MRKDYYKIESGYRILPNHPYIQNFWTEIYKQHRGWKVVWRDFSTMKQDVEFDSEKEAQEFCENLKRSIESGCTIDRHEFINGEDHWSVFRDKGEKDNDGFYESREWRELRYRVLKRDGAKCKCCGATSANGKKLHVDHIKPRAYFPELQLDISNLQVLCDDCNLGKGAWDETDWRKSGQ